MEKAYINQKELTELLGCGRRNGERVMKHLLKIAKEKIITYQKVNVTFLFLFILSKVS